MDNRNLFMSKKFSFISFFVAVVVETVLSVDEHFEACVPKNCGQGPNISYPFWLDGIQNSTCGFPGFLLSCTNREPILKMSGNEYIVRDIGYENESFFITNVRMPNDICSPLTYKLTFSRLPFSYASANASLSLFFNCTDLPSDQFSRYSLGCTTDNPRHRSLALFNDDPMLTYVNQSGQCETSVVTPIDKIGNGSLDATMSRDLVVDFLNKGFHLRWNASRCEDCTQSGGRCGFDYQMYKFMCFCPDRPYHRRCGGSEGGISLRARIGIVVSSSGVGILVMILILIRYIRNPENGILSWKKKTASTKKFEAFLKHHGSLALKRYNFKEVKTMTKSFENKLGQGGYGSVFKGTLNDGKFVAVKVLSETKGGGEEFVNEIASISRTSHVNIVSLLGYCFNGSKRALIYEFMPNGSLEKYIHNQKPSEANSHLGWGTLYQITVGIARGLEYLHRGCNTRILHFDIKPHNILLDQDFCPKISDFGLAKLCPRKESIISMLGARGTAGYIAPEVFSRNFGGVSHKSDVYSYGMMILEMVGGRKNIDVGVDHTSEIYFPSWIYKRIELDEDLGLHGVISKAEGEITRKMILVGLWCIQTNPLDRPSMSRVLEMLESHLEVLSIPPKPYLSSPPRVPEASSIS